MIKVKKKREKFLSQGDIIRNVEWIESVYEKSGNIEISKILFPLVIVLTQACDLAQDYNARNKENSNQDKHLLSVLVAPIYNVDHVLEGSQLSEIGRNMNSFKKNKTPHKNLLKNTDPRYHYLKFPDTIPVVPSVIDFKHYFAVNVNYLNKVKKKEFMCKVSEIYREQISLRFANFLSRIGLPD